jgi:hypothetical protein
MILLLVLGFLGEPGEGPLGLRAVLSAREAREMDGLRLRSIGVRWEDRTELGREPPPPPPSLTPPPSTVTLPLSYGVTVGVAEGVAVTEEGVLVWLMMTSLGVLGDGSRPRVAGVGVLSSRISLGRGTRNGSAEPGREAGVRS